MSCPARTQQTALVLRKSGLGDKLAKLAAFEQQRAEGKSSEAKLAAVPGMDQDSLAAAFKAFYGSVTPVNMPALLGSSLNRRLLSLLAGLCSPWAPL